MREWKVLPATTHLLGRAFAEARSAAVSLRVYARAFVCSSVCDAAAPRVSVSCSLSLSLSLRWCIAVGGELSVIVSKIGGKKQ